MSVSDISIANTPRVDLYCDELFANSMSVSGLNAQTINASVSINTPLTNSTTVNSQNVNASVSVTTPLTNSTVINSTTINNSAITNTQSLAVANIINTHDLHSDLATITNMANTTLTSSSSITTPVITSPNAVTLNAQSNQYQFSNLLPTLYSGLDRWLGGQVGVSGNLVNGTVTNVVFSNLTNVSGPSASSVNWLKLGDMISISFRFSITCSGVSNAVLQFTFNELISMLPTPFTNISFVSGIAMTTNCLWFPSGAIGQTSIQLDSFSTSPVVGVNEMAGIILAHINA